MKGGHAEHRGRSDKVLHLLFEIGIWFKGIDGVLECIGGLLLLFVAKVTLNRVVAFLTQHELVGDPTDWLANHLRQVTAHLSANTKVFAGAYLLGHGAVKVFLVWGGLLRRKLWSFPTAMAFLGAFIAYQVYRILHHYSWLLVALTVIDVFVLLLIWREYRMIKKGFR